MLPVHGRQGQGAGKSVWQEGVEGGGGQQRTERAQAAPARTMPVDVAPPHRSLKFLHTGRHLTAVGTQEIRLHGSLWVLPFGQGCMYLMHILNPCGRGQHIGCRAASLPQCCWDT